MELDSILEAIDAEYNSTASPLTATSAPPAEPLFTVRTANRCLADARAKPIPRMLFGELWHEGELAVLYSDTNLGKSILGVQIGDNISRNHSPPPFRMEAGEQPVLYFDYELTDKQFQQRYSVEYEREYRFSAHFYRIEINPDFTDYAQFEAALMTEMEAVVLRTGAKILIIDNLTYLKTQSTESAKEALPLMKFLKELKNRHGLSILALAHTPKRDNTRPLTVNDLAGSKHLANFADAMFAIGQSEQDTSLRYIKQIKARATAKLYDGENVLVCQLTKPYNFLGFEFVGYSAERDHLKVRTTEEYQDLDAQIIALRQTNPAWSNAAIARQLSTNPMKVGRVLQRQADQGSTQAA